MILVCVETRALVLRYGHGCAHARGGVGDIAGFRLFVGYNNVEIWGILRDERHVVYPVLLDWCTAKYEVTTRLHVPTPPI